MSKKSRQAPREPVADQQPTENALELPTQDEQTVNATEGDQPEDVVTTTQDSDEQPTQDDLLTDPPKAGARRYVVQWDVKRDGKRYALGDVIELTDEEAAEFAGSRAIVPEART